MTTLNSIIDIIGDTVFSAKHTNTGRTRMEQMVHENNCSRVTIKNNNFDNILYGELDAYEKDYNYKKTELKKALVNRKLLNIKISENNKKIDSLIADIKNCNFNTDMYNVDKELDRILNS